MNDCIELKNIRHNIIIGTRDEERNQKQEVIIALWIYTDFHKAAETDSLYDTVDYVNILEQIKFYCEKNEHFLLETLIENLAKMLLKIEKVEKIKIRIEKPNAVPPVLTALEIIREKKEYYATRR